MKRGSVWLIDFDPSVGGEIQKKRPAIILSNDIANKHLNRIQVIPLSSNTENLYPCECLIALEEPSKAMADQLTTVSKERCAYKIGDITNEQMSQVERIIKLQLGL